METHEFNDIAYDKDNEGIVTLTLNTPARKNALSAVTFLEIFWALEHFQSDDAAHAMIITGAKDPANPDPAREAFSSGGYFNPDAFEGLAPGVMEQIDTSDIAQKKVTLKFYECDKPVFAAVNGLAIGGAFTMALAGADQIYLSEHAWVQMPFAKLGIAAELSSTFLLPRLLGFQKAKELLYFPERLDANTLVEKGFANAVVPHDELMDFTRERARQLIPPHGAALSIREMKRIMHEPHLEALARALDLENEALRKLTQSEDFVEGLTARAQRREPQFKGR